MNYVIISLAAIVVAALTLFSGFGLGSLLMPVFAIFFPIEMAIAATAVVHLANNIFKVVLVGRGADFRIMALFALPAAPAAVGGALLLSFFTGVEPIFSYHLGSRECQITVVRIVVASLIILFSFFEFMPRLKKIALNKKYVPVGGILSGFFGGFSGHQGALRSAFLIRLGLTKEAFVGTAVVSAVIIDIFRIAVYGMTFIKMDLDMLEREGALGMIVVGIIAAFLGSFIGSRLLKKMTMDVINTIVGIMLMLLGLAIGSGVV